MNPLVVVRYVSRRRGETNVGGVWERRVEFKAGRPSVDFLVLQLQLLLATLQLYLDNKAHKKGLTSKVS